MLRVVSSVFFFFFVFTLVICPGESAPITMDQIDFTPDVVYGHKFGMALTFDVYEPKENTNKAGILMMVSGGMYSKWSPPEFILPWGGYLLEQGYTLFTVRHGSSPKFNNPEIAEDVLRSARYIRLNAKQFGVEPTRLGVFGASSGGLLTMSIATMADDGDQNAKDKVMKSSNRVAAVVAFFPPTDLREWVKKTHPMNEKFPALQFEEELAPKYSPLLHVTDDDAPALLIHGDQDTLVPIDHSEKIVEVYKKKNVPVELLTIKGAGHGFQGKDLDSAKKATLSWFNKYLMSATVKRSSNHH